MHTPELHLGPQIMRGPLDTKKCPKLPFLLVMLWGLLSMTYFRAPGYLNPDLAHTAVWEALPLVQLLVAGACTCKLQPRFTHLWQEISHLSAPFSMPG